MAQPILNDSAMRAALVRARLVPVATTIFASMLTLLPVVVPVPVVPPFGLMALLAWRLLQPSIWPVWAGLALGLFDDLLSGQPLGASMALWTLLLLALDFVDIHLVWRDFWIDWLIGGIALALGLGFGSLVSGVGANPVPVTALLPQLATAILIFPAVMRIVALLDRWRLPTREGA